MEVRCEKCETIYELEDSRVTDSGVDVKCVHCGNIFRARRRAPLITKEIASLQRPAPGLSTTQTPSTAEVAPQKERLWHLRIRKTDEIMRFRDLLALRQWIIDKRVTRDDDISRGGASYRRLGSIVELESFFFEAEQASTEMLRTGRRTSGSSSSSAGLPLTQEPHRLRTDTPGQGVGPLAVPSGIPPAHTGPDRQAISTMVGPGPMVSRPMPVEDGAPLAPLRLSGTGRTMRPRLGPQLGSGPHRTNLASNQAGSQSSYISPIPPSDIVTAVRVPIPKPDLPEGAVPQRIVSRPVQDKVRHVLPDPEPEILLPSIPPLPPTRTIPFAQGTPQDTVVDVDVNELERRIEQAGDGDLAPPSNPPLDLDEVLRQSDPVPQALKDVVSNPRELPEWPMPKDPEGKIRDDDDVDVVPRSTGFYLALALLAAVVCAAILAGIYYFVRPFPGQRVDTGAPAKVAVVEPPKAPEPVLPRPSGPSYLEKGELALRGDTDADYQQAHDHFLRAAGADDKDARPLRALSELHALWAFVLGQDASMAEAAQAPFLRKEEAHHRDLSQRYAAQALTTGKSPNEPVGLSASSVSKALTALLAGQTKEARELLLPLASGDPPPLRILMLLGYLERQEGNREAARGWFEKVRAQNPRHLRAEAALASLATQAPPLLKPDAGASVVAPQPPPAAAPISPPKEVIPTDLQGLLRYAQKLLDQERPREAERIYRQLLVQYPNEPEVHIGLGACAVDTARFQAAVGHYQNALERRPDYPGAMIGLAEAYKLRGDNQRALQTYREYVAKHPRGPQVDLAERNITQLSAILEAPPPPGEEAR